MTAPTIAPLGSLAAEVAGLRAPASPLIGEGWFGGQGSGARSVLMAVPLSPAMMTAALFFACATATPADLADDAETWGLIAQEVAEGGTAFLEEMTERLPELERAGQLPPVPGQGDGAAWLETCRRRVAELTGIRP